MGASLFSPIPILFFARLTACIAAVLVSIWTLHFKTSFTPHPASTERLIYAALHPLLMVIGFILISGEAILVHRWLPGSRHLKKSVHLCLQGMALASGIFGIWTKFHGEDGIVANFYSLHSWMGLICISMFGAQVVCSEKSTANYTALSCQDVIGVAGGPFVQYFCAGLLTTQSHDDTSRIWTIRLTSFIWSFGFMSFWHKGEVRTSKLRLVPWHAFLGLYTYGLAVVTAETGLLEKLTLLQVQGNVLKRCTETTVVNGLGICLAVLSSFVILAAVLPKKQSSNSRIIYSYAK